MKKIQWSSVFSLLFTMSTGYLIWLMFLGSGIELGKINHFYMIFAGLGISFFILFIFNVPRMSQQSQQRKWWEEILFILGVIVSCVTLALSMIMIMAGIGLLTNAVSEKFAIMFNIYLICLGFTLFVFLAYCTRYKVKNDTVIVLNGKILYPGTDYWLWPVFEYETEVMEKYFKLPRINFELHAVDKIMDVEYVTLVELRISDAKESGISELNVKRFTDNVQKFIVHQINNWGQTNSVSALMAEGCPSTRIEEFAMTGFPINWSGKGTFIVRTRELLGE